MWKQLANGDWSHPVWGVIPQSRLGGLTPQQIFGTVGDSPQAVASWDEADRTLAALNEFRNADQKYNPDEGAGAAGSPYFANAEWDELLPRDVEDNQTFDPLYAWQAQTYGPLWSQGLAKVMPGDPAVKDWSQVYVDPTYGLVTQHANASDPSSMFDLVKDWATTFGPFAMPAFMGMTGLGQIASNAVGQIPGVSELGNFLSDLGGQIASGLDDAVSQLPGAADSVGSAAGASGGAGTFPGGDFSLVPDGSTAGYGGVGSGGLGLQPVGESLIPGTVGSGGLGLQVPAGGGIIGDVAAALGATGSLGTSTGLNIGGGAAPVVTPGGSTPNVFEELLKALSPTGTATSALAKALGISDELASLLGTGVSAALGYNAADDQLDWLTSVYNTQRAERAPFLGAATGMVTDPSKFFAGPIGTEAARATANALSANYGNLFDNPTGQATLMQGLSGQYLNTVNSLGSLGLGGQGTQANLASGVASAIPGPANVVGGALGMLSAPRTNVADMFKALQQPNVGLV